MHRQGFEIYFAYIVFNSTLIARQQYSFNTVVPSVNMPYSLNENVCNHSL